MAAAGWLVAEGSHRTLDEDSQRSGGNIYISGMLSIRQNVNTKMKSVFYMTEVCQCLLEIFITVDVLLFMRILQLVGLDVLP